jgi:carboxyl-terminal processing protease
MRMTRKWAIAALVLVPAVAGGFMLQTTSSRDGLRLFDQVLSIVSDRFVDTVDANALYEKAARGLVKELNDPYSELFSPKQLREFNTRTGGRYGGVGMLIEDQKGNITISRVFPNTPAERAGVREGDRIVMVDTLSTAGWKLGQVSDYLVGTPGTQVSVKFARTGVAQPIPIRFTRATIHIPAVPYAIMLDGKIGYIPFQQFNETSAAEVREAVLRLSNEGAKGLVLDMRDNPGGILDEALEISNLFLPQNAQLASVRGRNTDPLLYMAREKPIASTVPLIILTNGYTASASEIVAGALQDHDRALILGTTSFGKGLVQSVFPLDGGYALKMTTGKWYTPNGRSIQKERKLLPDGELVEVHPDSLETDSARRARPAYKSDGGRVVYGGGAITPDVIVALDTLSTAEQQLAKALAPKSQELYVTLYDFALELKGQVTSPSYAVKPEWRDEFLRRLEKAGVTVDRKQWNAGATFVDRLLEQRVSRLAFGDSTAKRREISDDAQLERALDLFKKGQTQKDLLTLAQAAQVERAPRR